MYDSKFILKVYSWNVKILLLCKVALLWCLSHAYFLQVPGNVSVSPASVLGSTFGRIVMLWVCSLHLFYRKMSTVLLKKTRLSNMLWTMPTPNVRYYGMMFLSDFWCAKSLCVVSMNPWMLYPLSPRNERRVYHIPLLDWGVASYWGLNWNQTLH